MTSHRRLSASLKPQYYKKMGENTIETHIGKKSKKDNKKKTIAAISNGIRNKINTIPVTPNELERFEGKEAETEDLAESVDSGCIPDSSSDITTDIIDSVQMEAALIEENRFITGLLRWLPAPLQSEDESEPEARKSMKRKLEEKQKTKEGRLGNKKQKVGVDVVGTHADLDQLQERYRSTLHDLRKNRNKKWDHAAKKKEAKLARKLKTLERRKDKRTKKIKMSVQPEFNREKKKHQISPKNVRAQKPIYNQKGELVFSKFDFSNSNLSADIDPSTKSKDLKQILSQALKEKEKMKLLEKKGDKEGAINVAEQKAWSGALQKAEGKKVKSDINMLKKSIKKQENQKKTSQKKWEQRLETIQKSKIDKQNQRKKNISSRKEAKLDKKIKKMKKKGHIVPGF